MTDEEKKAIKMLDKFITEHKLFNIKQSDGLEEAIETLLTAYEKEKEKNKEYKDMIIRHKKQLKQSGIYGYDYDLEILEEE